MQERENRIGCKTCSKVNERAVLVKPLTKRNHNRPQRTPTLSMGNFDLGMEVMMPYTQTTRGLLLRHRMFCTSSRNDLRCSSATLSSSSICITCCVFYVGECTCPVHRACEGREASGRFYKRMAPVVERPLAHSQEGVHVTLIWLRIVRNRKELFMRLNLKFHLPNLSAAL